MSTLSDFFEKVANEIIEKKRNKSTEKDKFVAPKFNTSKCEDQYVGLIRIERLNARYCKWIKCSLKEKELRSDLHNELKEEKLPIFAIVLESPHTDEYKTTVHNIPIPMPAIGDTGENIQDFLPKYINRMNATCETDKISKGVGYIDIPSGIYRVLLVNAIQFQCSLGEKTELYRTNVFKNMWKEEAVKKDFFSRIDIPDVKIILNSCTNGNKNSTIRKIVQNEIDKIKSNCIKLHSLHPSSWQKCLGIEPEGWDN